MSPAALPRHQAITSDHVIMLTNQLRTHAGIKIDSPQAVVEDNIRVRMQALGIQDLHEYLAVFDDSISARAEWLALVDLLTVKETRFFRQPEAMQGVSSYVTELMTGKAKPLELSFWSAGCAAGQELYSIAMVVEQILAQDSPWVEWHGIGTDISFEAINKAQSGRYRETAIQTIPIQYRHPFVSKVSEAEWEISDSIRSRSHFFHSNLMHVDDAPFSDFNIIFCQNVLIYFEHDMQLKVIDQLVDRLKTGGLLVLGAGDDVRWTNPVMRRAQWPGVCAYIKVEV